MKLSMDVAQRKDPTTIDTLLKYNSHLSSQVLVQDLLELTDDGTEGNVTKLINRSSNSPHKNKNQGKMKVN